MSGNPGIAAAAECVPEPEGGVEAIAHWAKQSGIDLVVVGPEAYLDRGLVDACERAGVKAFGPTRSAAAIESSKSFAKELMARANIPTAKFAVCDSPAAARQAARRFGAPVVVKAEGLAAGKGVTVALTLEEADRAISLAMEQRVFGEAGARLVIEEFMEGEEASVLAFVDGERVVPMPAAQDHKRVGDGDTGPNTGGMGAYSPAPVVTPAISERVAREILEPAVRAMAEAGRPYRGVLYAGLMITAEGPKVVEFNCRFGDPEAQAVLPRLKSDFASALLATIDGRLDEVALGWDERAAVCVVLASGGYPGKYETGFPIDGLDEAGRMEDIIVFHAGTRENEGRIVTAGGRVLCVTALGSTIAEATRKAYAAAEMIHFQGKHMRTDIAAKALKRISH